MDALTLGQVFRPNIRFNELMFVYHAFVQQQQQQRVWSQEERQVSQHSLFVFLLSSTCVHHLLESLGFIWYLFVVVPMLAIPQHGVFKELPDCVTMDTQTW